jgi:hypothetical protein
MSGPMSSEPSIRGHYAPIGALLLLVTTVLAVLACLPDRVTHAPQVSTKILGKVCKVSDDCGPGLACHSYSHPECPDGKCQTCEIRCVDDAQCPAGYACNLPPLLPDTVPNICAIRVPST